MCGIAGFVDFRGLNKTDARQRIDLMTDAIAHRGPDQAGRFTDSFAALGHRRLSIIDIASGAQPMTEATSRFQIVFNGEIYNFQDIRNELKEKGYRFATRSDTEVILNAYREWGRASVEKFNGMFAFAVWDTRDRELFVARDRVGKKPFYYFCDGNRFAFASEIKALLAGGWSEKDILPQALDAYFCFGYIPCPMSVFSDIRKLPPAHTMTVRETGIETERYWDLAFSAPRDLTVDEALEELDPLMADAVRCRLMSEVPLGAFLSAGIDSGLVVSYMARLTDTPVLTNTIGFGERKFSEAPGARLVADHFGTDHHEYVVSPDDWDTITRIASVFDEPFADSSALPTWHVCEKARKQVTVALSGDGGDESFAGYTFRYLPHLLESRIRSLVPPVVRTSLLAGIGRLYPGSSRLPRFLRLKTIFENLARGNGQAFYSDLIWLREDRRASLYSREFTEALCGFTPAELVIPLYENSPAQDALSKAQYTDIRFYMTDDVLVKTDRMSMAHGLEVRNPLLDYRILEFAAGLNRQMKINGNKGKYLLRRLAANRLPDRIVNLPKQGFSIPAAGWLRGPLKSMAKQTVFGSPLLKDYLEDRELRRMWRQHQSGFLDHSVFLWGAMMLGLWEKEYH